MTYLRTAPGEASQSSCIVLWVISVILNSPDGGRGTKKMGEIQQKQKKQTNKRWECDSLRNIPAEGKKALVPPTGHPLISERATGVIAVQGEDGNAVGRVGTKFLQLDISNSSFHTHLWRSTTSQIKGMVDLITGTWWKNRLWPNWKDQLEFPSLFKVVSAALMLK